MTVFVSANLAWASPVQANNEIIVSAAASLANVMSVLGTEFETVSPNVTVIFNIGSSGSLLQQMIHGAPVDVFASANQIFMERAQHEGLVLEASKRNFAGNQLVLAAPVGTAIVVQRVEDLRKADIRRIALGNPNHSPAGEYARQALKRSGLWGGVSRKLVFANNVQQVLDYLIRGEVDIGVLYATDVISAEKKGVQTVLELRGHDPIVYPIAALATSRDKGLACLFVEFVVGDKGQQILETYGFKRATK